MTSAGSPHEGALLAVRALLDAPDLAAARAAAPPALRDALTPAAFAAVRGVATAVDHTAGGPDVIRRLREGFDRAAAVSPEAAAALHSLGDPRRLAALTDEVAGWLRAEGLHRPGGRVLEVGCGAGRFLRALGRDADLALGVEISLALARAARAAGAAAVVGSGEGLPFVRPGAFDLVLYADSFPYVVQAGVEAAHLRDAARALAPGGRLAVLNWSYRGGRADGWARDRADARALPAAGGLRLERERFDEFRLWDGAAFVFASARGGA